LEPCWRPELAVAAQELAYTVNDSRSKVLLFGPKFAATLAALQTQMDLGICIALEGAVIDGALNYDAGLDAVPETEPTCPIRPTAKYRRQSSSDAMWVVVKV